MLIHILKSVISPFGLMLAVLAFVQLILFARLCWTVRRCEIMPPGVLQLFTHFANGGEVREATILARIQTSPFSKVLAAGLFRLDDGIETARDSARRRAEALRARLEAPLHYLAAVATLGTVVGLAGTVYGIIQTYLVMSVP